MVPTEGVEPTHPFGYQILSLARLPIPPRRHGAHSTEATRSCQQEFPAPSLSSPPRYSFFCGARLCLEDQPQRGPAQNRWSQGGVLRLVAATQPRSGQNENG